MEAEEADNFNLEAELIRLTNEVKLSEQRLSQESANLARKLEEFREQEEKTEMLDNRFRLIVAFTEQIKLQHDEEIIPRRDALVKMTESTLDAMKKMEQSFETVSKNIDDLEITADKRLSERSVQNTEKQISDALQQLEALKTAITAKRYHLDVILSQSNISVKNDIESVWERIASTEKELAQQKAMNAALEIENEDIRKKVNTIILIVHTLLS